MAGEAFDRDLAFGEERESAFVQTLRDCKVEMKSDQKTRVTGNVFIEFQQRGRPSGIATSAARWYHVEVEDDVWITMRTSALKALARQAIAVGRVKEGGDNENVGALIPVEWLVRRWRGVPE